MQKKDQAIEKRSQERIIKPFQQNLHAFRHNPFGNYYITRIKLWWSDNHAN
jgi:hypothetical protein